MPPHPMKSKFTCDQLIDHEIHGWGSVEQATAKKRLPEEDFIIQLKAGSTVIAQQRRTMQRPDADRAAGQPGVAKGYRMPALAAAAALAVLGNPAGLPLTMAFADTEIDFAKQPSRLLDLGQFRSLRLWENGGPVFIADIWFASDYELRMRLEKVSKVHGLAPPYKVQFFQPEFVPGVRLALIGEAVVASESMSFLSPFLRNPLLPLLFTVSAANGDIAAMDLIPFPSLCRGGLHHAELEALATGAGYIGDLRSISDSYLRDATGVSAKGASGRIETIRADMRGARGAERLLSPAVLQWLVLGRQLRIEALGETADPEEGALLDRAIADLSVHMGASRRKTGLTLTIPADAVPSLAALNSGRFGTLPGGKPLTCSFVTANAATGAPLWYVSVPAAPAWLKDVQPAQAPMLAPILESASSAKSSVTAAGPAGSIAMAVRFLDESFKSDDTRLLPIAPDRREVVSAAAADSGETRIAVAVSVRNGAPQFSDMLSSLASQSVASRIDLIIVNNRSFASARVAIEAAAASLFRGRYTIIEYDEPFNHSDQTNRGVAAARSNHVCLIDSDIVLHDPRTIATLLRLSQCAEAATVGCMLVEPRPGKTESFRFRSAGIFPSGMSFGGRPRVSFAEPDCGAVFGPAVYPVAANSFALAMIRKDCWDATGGLDPARLGSDHNDIDFCLRAMDKGYVNLCTTAVSAFHIGRASRGTAFDVMASDLIAQPSLAALLGQCTVLRRIG